MARKARKVRNGGDYAILRHSGKMGHSYTGIYTDGEGARLKAGESDYIEDVREFMKGLKEGTIYMITQTTFFHVENVDGGNDG